jgi:hypothetical protein
MVFSERDRLYRELLEESEQQGPGVPAEARSQDDPALDEVRRADSGAPLGSHLLNELVEARLLEEDGHDGGAVEDHAPFGP